MIREFRIVGVLLVLALVWPAACNYVDQQRRLEARAQAFSICLGHRAHIEDCTHIRPPYISQAARAVCEWRFDPRACAEMRSDP